MYEEKNVQEKYIESLKKRITELQKEGWLTEDLLACVHELYQDYRIEECDEEMLYKVADPKDECNDVFQYYYNYRGENPLMEVNT